jgi:hypothetical protein
MFMGVYSDEWVRKTPPAFMSEAPVEANKEDLSQNFREQQRGNITDC